MNLVNIVAAVIGSGVLERYPSIRIAFGESGIGWLPYALDRMDFEWEDRFTDLGLKMQPSDYWRRQCKATFQFDRIGTKLIDEMGVETLMWGSDYPHGVAARHDEQDHALDRTGRHADLAGRARCARTGPDPDVRLAVSAGGRWRVVAARRASVNGGGRSDARRRPPP